VQPKFSIHSVFPNYFTGTWVSYSLTSIIENMCSADVNSHAYVLAKARDVHSQRVSALLPNLGYKLTNRFIRSPAHSLVRRFAHRFNPGDVVYFWLNSPIPLVKQLQTKGVLVVREMINCTKLMRRRELRSAYSLLGLPDLSAISDEDIAAERAELLAADAVFCPNEFVFESAVEYGVPVERCIRTSYGWGSERITPRANRLSDKTGVDFLFVGTGDVRKGLPWLLEAWEQAGVMGKLYLAGSIDAFVRMQYERILRRPDVVELGHIKDISAVYSAADVFCFPSWEEGGPMVTIEAMASGLPCIVTPMGSAGIIKNSAEGGIIVPPGDTDAMSSAIRQLAANPSMRTEFGNRAHKIALNYTWRAVGRKRLESLLRYRESRGSS
jgi:glycosyltransferase involved in cell wall biosynthesis